MKKITAILFILVNQVNASFADSVAVNFSGNVRAAGKCVSNQSTISVILPDVYDTDFKGVGSTASNQTFNLSLTCTGAITSIKPYVRLLPGNAGVYNSSQGVLNLDASSTASGFGIQVLYNNTPVVMNSNINLDTISYAGMYNYSYFSARYYQTATNVKEGTVNANATLEITYQ